GGLVADLPGVAEFVIVGLAGAAIAAQDAGHGAVAFGGYGGAGVDAGDACDLAAGRLEHKVIGVGIGEPAGTAIGAEIGVAHDLAHVGQIPAHQVGRVTDAAVEPLEGR